MTSLENKAIVGTVGIDGTDGTDGDGALAMITDDEVTIKQGESKFVLSKRAAYNSNFIKTALENDPTTSTVDVTNIKSFESKLLPSIVEFLQLAENDPYKPIPAPLRGNTLSDFVSKARCNFIERFTPKERVDILNAANFFDCNDLLQLAAASIAIVLKKEKTHAAMAAALAK